MLSVDRHTKSNVERQELLPSMEGVGIDAVGNSVQAFLESQTGKSLNITTQGKNPI